MMWFLNSYFSNIYIDPNNLTSKKLAKFKNEEEFQNFLALFANQAFQAIDIENLPKACSRRVVIQSIIWYGSVCFFKKAGEVLALPGLPCSDFTLNGEPTEAIVYGRNGYTEHIKLFIPGGDDSELVRRTTTGGTAPITGTGCWIRANYLAYPLMHYIINYASKCADTMRTLDVTRANIKRPYLVSAEESIVNSVKSFFNKRDNNEEFVVSSGIFPADKISLLPFETNPENIRDCTMLIEWYQNQLWSILGIKAPNVVDKKAEITTDELYASTNIQDVNDGILLNTIQEGLDFVNEKLGTNMKVISRNQSIEANDQQDNGDIETPNSAGTLSKENKNGGNE